MNWYSVGLFLHLGCVVAAFWFAAGIHLGMERLWAAETAGDALAALDQTHRGATPMPWIGVLLFLTGAYLTQTAWNWSLPWISLSILGLIIIEGFGGASGKCRRRLRQMLDGHAASAPLPETFVAAARGRLPRTVHYLLPLLTLGVMLVMVTKPGALGGVVELAIAALIGVVWAGRRRETRSRTTPQEVARS
jgi:hypothetical protein